VIHDFKDISEHKAKELQSKSTRLFESSSDEEDPNDLGFFAEVRKNPTELDKKLMRRFIYTHLPDPDPQDTNRNSMSK